MRANWSSHKIKYEMGLRGLKFRALERQHDLPANSIRNALHEPHERGEQVIAAALQKSPHQIWPRRYDKQGNRLQPQPLRNYRPRRSYRTSQKRSRAADLKGAA